jgi:hypothetical protein
MHLLRWKKFFPFVWKFRKRWSEFLSDGLGENQIIRWGLGENQIIRSVWGRKSAWYEKAISTTLNFSVSHYLWDTAPYFYDISTKTQHVFAMYSTYVHPMFKICSNVFIVCSRGIRDVLKMCSNIVMILRCWSAAGDTRRGTTWGIEVLSEVLLNTLLNILLSMILSAAWCSAWCSAECLALLDAWRYSMLSSMLSPAWCSATCLLNMKNAGKM